MPELERLYFGGGRDQQRCSAMRRPRSATARRDLVAVAALACAGLAVALLADAVWLRVVALVPLVLFLPGYAARRARLRARHRQPG